MAKLNYGGPVHPIPEVRDADGNGIMEGWRGMALRDWFAGQALASFVPDTPQNKAEAAYAIADAMLAERARTGGNP